MAKIQIDMYEVQLGASLLLQFKDKGDKDVRVLADAGIDVSKKKGYLQDHVYKKLRQTLGAGKVRLDLMVGTHYDEDHIVGLVPIIQDANIEIGEAWLPPVANDTEHRPAGIRVSGNHLLALQFAGENGQAKLVQYLKSKQAKCEELRALERGTDEHRDASLTRQSLTGMVDEDSFTWDGNPETAVEYFSFHRDDAAATLGDLDSDTDLHDFSFQPGDSAHAIAIPASRRHFIELDMSPSGRTEYFNSVRKADSFRAEADAVSLAYIRKSNAKEAITASHLAKVVIALKERNIPIACHIIEDGKPLRFVWDIAQRRFIPGAKLHSDGPEVTLLGPSQSLVKKHRDKLPIGSYFTKLAYEPVEDRSITESNQLSYVLRFEAEKQGILVSGDAGCVDFKSGSAGFYPELLAPLLPLHVIQVAHHAGCNADFYNVLLEAGYPAQTDKSLLLLSHATNDPTRPSKEFGAFIGQARQPGDDMQLLFTSRPTADKVRDYTRIIHESVGETGDVGDVKLTFNGKVWKVDKHAISLGVERSLLASRAEGLTAKPVKKGGKKKTSKTA